MLSDIVGQLHQVVPYVEELKVIGGGHDWPGSFGNMTIDANIEIWQFVSRYDINGLIGCITTSVTKIMDRLKIIRYFQILLIKSLPLK